MGKGTLVALGALCLVGLAFFGGIGLYFSGNNTGNRYETTIKAAHEQSRNVLGQYAPMLKETLGVSKLQAQAVADVITGANESRYGKDGSQASVQWISEQNPTLDQSGYARVLNIIEAGRRDFQTAQKTKIDMIRAYEAAQGQMPGGFFIRLAGYPTAAYTSANYGKIVTSGHSQEAFATGTDDGVDLKGL